MKKIFFSLLAIAALASCAKTEAVYTTDNSEIQIAPVTAMTTKADKLGVIDGTEYPTEEEFNVYAYWANESAGSSFTADQTGAGAYLNNVTFTNKGQFWGGVTTQYWPKNGSLRFAAYSPATINMQHVLATDTYTGTVNYTASTAQTFDILVAPTSKSYTAQTAAEKVSVVFEHALSWLTFQIKSTDVANNAFTIHNVTVDGVNIDGTLVAEMNLGTKTWTTENAQDVAVFNGSRNATTTAVDFEDVAKGLLVLPQQPTTVTINFTQNAVGSAPALANQTVTLPLTLVENEPWEAGKHYTYTVIFDLDEILINPDVENWEEVTVPEIDATATEVSTSEELVEAVAAGRSVRLAENIQLDAPIIVDPAAYATRAGVVDVKVDLNGKTITAPLFTESNGTVTAGSTDSYGFWVKEGATLTIDGPGKVQAQACKYSMAVWADGGKVIINGGEFANAGEGSDLIYAKNGGQVEIYGGVFKACPKGANVEGTAQTYTALNLHDGTKNISSITVYGGTFYNFDPANNKSENPAVNFVADGYGSYELEAGVWTVLKNDAQIKVASNAALEDVATWGGNAILTSDLTLSGAELNVPAGRTVVLDLNGKTLTVASLDPIKNLGTMSLLNGNIVANNSENTRRCVYNYGTMTIDGVKFVQTYSKKGAAINNEGKLTIESAEVDAVFYSIWSSGEGTETIINGGSYTSMNDVNDRETWAYAVAVRNGANLIVNDGTFVGNHGAVAAEGGTAVLNDGNYECTAAYTGNSDWVLYAATGGNITYDAVTCTIKTANPNGAIYGDVVAK